MCYADTAGSAVICKWGITFTEGKTHTQHALSNALKMYTKKKNHTQKNEHTKDNGGSAGQRSYGESALLISR